MQNGRRRRQSRFRLPKMNPRGARDTDSLFRMRDANASAAREIDEEFRRVKDNFLLVARQHRRQELSRSESSRSPSPIRHRSSRRSKNSPKFKIAPFYANDVELWFNQLETQFALHDITDDDERYRLTCAALSGEVASDVRDILLHPFLSHKYISLKGVLIERRGLTHERVNKVIRREAGHGHSFMFSSTAPEDRWIRNDSSSR